MMNTSRHPCLAICLVISGIGWFHLNATPARCQEESPAAPQVHNAPENVKAALKGNQVDLLSAWRLLSHLAVRLFSGNQAELLSGNAPKLLADNSTALLSGNAPELLSGNKAKLLSDNDPQLLAGNRVLLFSNNTVQIHVNESGNNAMPPDPLGRSLSAPRARWEGPQEPAERQEARLQAPASGAERAKAAIEKERAESRSLAAELSALRAKLKELATENDALRARIAELESAK